MRQLLQTLAAPLAEGVSLGGPFVYVTAIHSTAGLTRSLAGITLISREMGFERFDRGHPARADLFRQCGRCGKTDVIHHRSPS